MSHASTQPRFSSRFLRCASLLLLAGFGSCLSAGAATIVLDPAAVRVVVRDVLTMAERFYDSGLAGVRYLPARVRPAIVAAAFLYRGIGRALLRRGGDPLAGRVVLGTWERAWLAFAGLMTALLPTPHTPHDPDLHIALRGIMPEPPCPIA